VKREDGGEPNERPAESSRASSSWQQARGAATCVLSGWPRVWLWLKESKSCCVRQLREPISDARSAETRTR